MNGRPDPRPTVRELAPGQGDLREAFDFLQPPNLPLILPVYSEGLIQADPHTAVQLGLLASTDSRALQPGGEPHQGFRTDAFEEDEADDEALSDVFRALAPPADLSLSQPRTVLEVSLRIGVEITGTAPFKVRFDGSGSTGSAITSWMINFGDGTLTNGTGCPPLYQRNTPGQVTIQQLWRYEM